MSDGTGEVRIEGLQRLVTTMRKAGEDLSDLKAANARAADIVIAAAESLAPRRSGKLASSLRSSKVPGRARILAGRASVPYAMPIHWGWPARNIEPNPFVSMAAQQTESEWLPAYLEDVEKALSQIEGV